MLKLTIPVVPPSPNKLMRMHYIDRYKLMNMWEWLVKLELCNANLTISRASTKKKISIVQFRKRLLDPDNLYGSCKPVLDALTKNFIIVDDSDNWIILEVRQTVDTKNIRTEILISD